jgi:hypothetical protein
VNEAESKIERGPDSLFLSLRLNLNLPVREDFFSILLGEGNPSERRLVRKRPFNCLAADLIGYST